METYISLLRGINVSGQKKVSMKELKSLYESLGYDNVRTYIQSGNVVFNYRITPPAWLAKEQEEIIAGHFGFNVPVQIRTQSQMQQVIKGNPFPKAKEDDKIYVIFLASPPAKDNLDKMNALSYEPEQFVIMRDTIYFYCPNGYGNAKLNNNVFENKLKVAATTRNWKTVNVLAEMD